MTRSSFALATVLSLALVGAAFGDPLVSGPQPGQKVPGPVFPLHVTGPDAGQQVCLYCKNGVNPVAMIFARELTPAVAELLTRIDAATVANQKADMGSFAVFLNDAKELPPAASNAVRRQTAHQNDEPLHRRSSRPCQLQDRHRRRGHGRAVHPSHGQGELRLQKGRTRRQGDGYHP